ncbi:MULTISPECIES: transposase [unclassified Streptomyces]|uniref:transposase n=1 Tax=unclassified Streptomyces TaxID=2593676 RepID=UPI003433B9D2
MLIEVDVETRRPVDLVPDREADARAAWLPEWPGIEIVCRDRASFFAEGATRGAPQALQVADRWHLWHNLGEADDKCVYRHRGCLRPTPAQHLERDLDAVTAGLTLPWNSGVVEGHAIRIKMLRRQMFGREGFDLLRKRLLLA